MSACVTVEFSQADLPCRDTASRWTSQASGFYSLTIHSFGMFLSLVGSCFGHGSTGAGHRRVSRSLQPSSCGFCPLQREAFDEGPLAGLTCGFKDTYFECSQELYRFSEVVLGCSLRFMISLALESWLGFHYHNDIPLLGMPYIQLVALGHLQDISATTAPSEIFPCWLLLWLKGIIVGKTDSPPLLAGCTAPSHIGKACRREEVFGSQLVQSIFLSTDERRQRPCFHFILEYH